MNRRTFIECVAALASSIYAIPSRWLSLAKPPANPDGITHVCVWTNGDIRVHSPLYLLVFANGNTVLCRVDDCVHYDESGKITHKSAVVEERFDGRKLPEYAEWLLNHGRRKDNPNYKPDRQEWTIVYRVEKP